jgi:hypothetical protein
LARSKRRNIKIMSNKKQTAVEWLYDRFLFAGYAVNPEWKEQAKEMEKQQIIDAMDVTQRTDFYVKYEGSEQYYNETYEQ